MTYKYLRGDLKPMLELAIEHRLPEKVEEWKTNLAKGRLTTEMRDCFAAFGWISSRQDARLTDVADTEARTAPGTTEVGTAPPGTAAPVKVREPDAKGA